MPSLPAFPHMRRPRLGRPDAPALAIAAVALIGAAMVLYRQSAYGVMLSGDSVHFVAVARNWLEGDGFITFDGRYQPSWAPLTPILYAVFGFGVFDPLAVAGPLNAAAMALTVFAVGAWLRRRLESRLVVVWACIAVALGISVVRMFDFVWSEPFFIPLCALALYWADRHLEDGKRSSLAWAAAFSTLLCLSRYIGVAAVVFIAGMFLLRRGVSLRERFAGVAAYSAVSLAPLCAWMARNWLVAGAPTGARYITETALEHVAPMLEEIAKWWLPYVPVPGAESAAAWVMAAMTMLTAALGMFTLARWLRTGADAFVPLTVGFVFAYAAFMLMALRTGVIGMDRYVIPMYVPLLVAAAFALDRALAWARGVRFGGRAIPAAALIAALAAWTAYGGFIAASDAYETANGDGQGRMARAFYESETITFLRERRGANVGMTFSNEPLQAYLASDGRGLFPFPHHSWSEMSADLEKRHGAADETLIVWFHDANLTTTRYGAAAFLFSPGFERLGVFQDGAVFRLKPGYDPLDPRDGTLIEDSYYDVYLNDGALTWVRQPCSDEDARGIVELWAQPVKPSDESAAVSMNFDFGEFGVKTGDLCAIRRALPDYPIKTVATGQFIPGGKWFYRTRIRMPLSDEALAYYRAKYESAAAAGELLARSDFDVYLDGGEIVYLKEPCAEEDTRGSFGLSAFPVDAAHFPEGEGRGHQSLNFAFENHGVIFEGRCMARRTLPDYTIRALDMSQWLADGSRLWGKAVQMPLADSDLAAYREKYAALSARRPLARAGLFDLHVNGGELAYLKRNCYEKDARGHFHLRIYPVEIDALPQELRRDGHEFIRFEFVQRGIRLDGGCLIAAPLPDYMIRTIEASQNIPFEGNLWKTTFSPPLSDEALAYYRDEYDAVEAREPLARSDFDVYRDGGDLVYLKRPCAESDTAGRFSLTAFPARADDLHVYSLRHFLSPRLPRPRGRPSRKPPRYGA